MKNASDTDDRHGHFARKFKPLELERRNRRALEEK